MKAEKEKRLKKVKCETSKMGQRYPEKKNKQELKVSLNHMRSINEYAILYIYMPDS